MTQDDVKMSQDDPQDHPRRPQTEPRWSPTGSPEPQRAGPGGPNPLFCSIWTLHSVILKGNSQCFLTIFKNAFLHTYVHTCAHMWGVMGAPTPIGIPTTPPRLPHGSPMARTKTEGRGSRGGYREG